MLCPKCGSQNDDSSKFCLNCGQALALNTNEQAATPPPSSPAPPPVQPAPPAQTWAPPPSPVAPPPKKKNKGCMIAVIIVIILLILGLVAAGIIGFKVVRNAINDELASEFEFSQNENKTQANNDGDDNDDDYDNNDNDNDYNNDDEDNNGGGNFSFTGSWPDDPLLKDVPKPGVGSIFSSSSDDSEITIMFTGWDRETFVDYIEKLKKAGFDKNVDQVDMGFVSSYEADNGKVTVNLAQSMGYYILTVNEK